MEGVSPYGSLLRRTGSEGSWSSSGSLEDGGILPDLAWSIEKREALVEQELSKSENKNELLLELYRSRRAELISQLQQQQSTVGAQGEWQGGEYEEENYYEFVLEESSSHSDARNRRRRVEAQGEVRGVRSGLEMWSFLKDQVQKCRDMQSRIEEIQRTKLEQARRELQHTHQASSKLASSLNQKLLLVEQARMEQKNKYKQVALQTKNCEINYDSRTPTTTERKANVKPDRIELIKVNETNQPNGAAKPETKEVKEAEDLEQESLAEEEDGYSCDSDDPLMVECVECGRWVVATTHKNQLAIGYCCSNVLVSHIE